MTTLDYEVTNAVGTVLFTSPDLALARAFVREKCGDGPGQFPDLKVEEVTRTTIRRTAFRPKLRIVA